ncbi:DUF6478 family protein [Paracoccaceae bacterium GXU_MW_L88]
MGRLRDRYILRRALQVWRRRIEGFDGLSAPEQEVILSDAASLRAVLNGLPSPKPRAAAALDKPSDVGPANSDWAQRLGLTAERFAPRGSGTESGTAVATGCVLYHDGGPEAALMIGQDSAGAAPFPVVITTMGFTGDFLSLATGLPDEVAHSSHADHIFRLDWNALKGPTTKVYARFNIRSSAGEEEMTRLLNLGEESYVQFPLREFDRTDEDPIEAIWLDLIFADPARITVRFDDLILSRRHAGRV